MRNANQLNEEKPRLLDEYGCMVSKGVLYSFIFLFFLHFFYKILLSPDRYELEPTL